MLIKLQDFKEGEIVRVENSYDPKKLDLEFVDLHYSRPLTLEGTVEKGNDLLTFRGHLTSETELMCGRCLKRIQMPLDKEFELFYETKGKEWVDATDDIRELLLLDHSLAFLCTENCRGLCPKCGTNLNEAACRCEAKAEGSLAQLKDIWKQKKESK
jgi:uncharacterized protein